MNACEDEVAVEAPLEIRVEGEVLATTMRTPGSDVELVAGLLLSEGLVHLRERLGAIEAQDGVVDDMPKVYAREVG